MASGHWREMRDGPGRDPGARAEATALLLFGVAVVVLGCGGGAGANAVDSDPPLTGDAGTAPEKGGPDASAGTGTCAALVPASGDLCRALPTGSVSPCSAAGDGTPSPDGYLDVVLPNGSHVYSCSTSWSDNGSGGFWFDTPEGFMSDPQSCCGGTPTPVAHPAAPAVAFGPLGSLHGPREIKPQESIEHTGGALRQNPFAVVVRDPESGAAYAAAVADWQAWSTDGNPHTAPDGTGPFYFAGLGVNYAILAAADGQPVLVIGPEVSETRDGHWPLGHPTLGGCANGGGAPLVLMAGEIWGTTINNRSGRFNHDPAMTEGALNDAAQLFNCLGIPITATTYYPPKP